MIELDIIYTGKIYEKQNPALLLEGLRGVIDEGHIEEDEVSVDIYGDILSRIESLAKSYKLETIVKQHGRVSREQSLAIQREARLLWIMDWEAPKGGGVIPGKLFEYMAARRPVLCTGSYDNTEVERIINEAKIGVCCHTAEAVKCALIHLLY